MKILIVAVVYLEPDWLQTNKCIEESVSFARSTGIECEVHYVDRKGIGSLSEALNRGFKEGNGQEYDYIWFVTNVTFDITALYNLELTATVKPEYAGLHPEFESDHLHLRSDGSDSTLDVPYIEFTAAFVKAKVFAEFPLDQMMPYWGMDLDWSYRVAQAGHKLGCCHLVKLNHTYIRNAVKQKSERITRLRSRERKKTDPRTKKQLVMKYGPDWRQVLNYK